MNVAIIPARGGSVRIPRKNIRLFHGKPIIAYSIETAQASELFDRVVVSTEDEEIKAIAFRYGAMVSQRGIDLCAEDVGTQKVAAYALHGMGIENGLACCIYPCAPMLSVDDLRYASFQLEQMPYNYVYVEGIYYFGFARRFLDEPDNFNYSLRLEDRTRHIDINTEADWFRAERMYAELHKEAA